jgi:hypothetical protein
VSWRYRQSTGELTSDAGEIVGVGYSGAGAGKDNPAAQADVDVGPIPQGSYRIGAPQNTEAHGPFAMPLLPAPTNEMFGRAGFMLHGDSISHPGDASEGCIIMDRVVRDLVWNSGDHELQVSP